MNQDQQLRLNLCQTLKSVEEAKKAYNFILEGKEVIPSADDNWIYLIYNNGTYEEFSGSNPRDNIVEAAQKCWDFVRGGDEAKKQEPATEQLRDGVYLIDTKGNAVAFAGDDTCTVNDTAYIGIVQGSHSIAIALHDVSKDEITLTSKKDDGKGRYINSYMDAVQDWKGKQNTEHLQAAGLNPAIQLKDGEYIPTLAELYLICLNRKAINAAMRFVGGQELSGWYWSSTECGAAGAWILSLYDGNACSITEATSTGRVRPVSAFLHC